MRDEPQTERRVGTQEILLKENTIVKLTLGTILLVCGAILGAVVHAFTLGRSFERFNAQQAEVITQMQAMRQEISGVRAEMTAYVDSQVGNATFRRWTQAHEEVDKSLIKEALRKNSQDALAASWPTVDTVNEQVQKFSTADAAYKRSAPATPR